MQNSNFSPHPRLFLLLLLIAILVPVYFFQHAPPKVTDPNDGLIKLSQKAAALDIRVTLVGEKAWPLKVRLNGFYGGITQRSYSSLDEIDDEKFTSKAATETSSKPKLLQNLPLLCPRVHQDRNKLLVYDGMKDRFNRQPFLQFMDPDAKTLVLNPVYKQMDGNNVLLLKKMKIIYDYEDSNIIDYIGPKFRTKEQTVIYEGEGGFYANFHYAVVPFNKKYLNLDRQTLLHMVEGKLSEIDRLDLTPPLRTHSFIPGPFLSKDNRVYPLCEWGDTTYQAPTQQLTYTNISLWDWDYEVPDDDHVLFIVWEGDEEDWLIRDELINPFYLTDDLVGIFEIKRQDTINPLVLINKDKTVELTLQTGNMDTIHW